MRFLAAEQARALVVRGVIPMRVDGRRARLQPHARRAGCARDRFSDHPRRLHARLQNLASIGGRVAAIDAPTGQVDDDVGAVDLMQPAPGRPAIPRHHAPWRSAQTPAQDDDLVALAVKSAREHRSDLSGPARNDDLHMIISEHVH